MQSETLKTARKQLTVARRLIRERHFSDARNILEDISGLEVELDAKELVEASNALLQKLETSRRLTFSRWALITTTVLSAVVVAGLTFVPIRATQIGLKVIVSRAAFELDQAAEFGPLALKIADLSGAVTLDFLLTDVLATSPPDATSDNASWADMDALESASLGGNELFWSLSLRSRYLRLEDLRVPAKSILTVETSDTDPELVRINVSNGRSTGSFDVSDQVSVSCYECSLRTNGSARDVGNKTLLISSRDKKVGITSGTDLFSLTLTPADKPDPRAGFVIGGHFFIGTLSLTKQIDKRTLSSIALPSQVSLLELNGKEVVISPGDFLLFDDLTDFQIRSIRLDRHLTIDAVGTVGTLVKRSGSVTQSLIPSHIEWLLANHFLNTFIAALLPLLAAALAMLYRLKILDEG